MWFLWVLLKEISGRVLLQGSFFEGAAATTIIKFPSCSTYVATFHHINFAKVKLEVFFKANLFVRLPP